MGKKKILIADDEANIRMLFGKELEDEGFEVYTAASGEEAVEMFGRIRPDLVTLDIKMPGMGGIAALGAIREKDPTVPVIMLTAYSEFKKDFDVWAADAYIRKSGDVEELMAKVRFLLAS